MAYDFKRLSDVEMLNEVPEGATVLAEVNGSIKRVPGEGLGGGGGGIKTAIIKDSEYDNVLASGQFTGSETLTHECINMTFEEAYETIMNGDPLGCILMNATTGAPMVVPGIVMFADSMTNGIPCLFLPFGIVVSSGQCDIAAQLFWTADGLSTETPTPPVPPT